MTTFDAIVTGHDKWGPFKDDPAYGTPDARTIPYVIVVPAAGGSPFNVTLAQGVDPSSIPTMQAVKLQLELYGDGNGKLKARCHGAKSN